jgi:predicted CXXCH cytochrome family protein
VTCHNPHTADDPGLVRGRERDVCLSCHKDLKAQLATAVSTHPVKANGGRCTSCHAPHESNAPHLLKSKDINAVCGTCHKGHAQFGHPVGSNVIDPQTGDGMSCLSCHNAHVSQQRMMLKADPQRALCLNCHEGSDAMSAARPKGAS